MRCAYDYEEAEAVCLCKNIPMCQIHFGQHIIESGHSSFELLILSLSSSESNSLKLVLFDRIKTIELSKAKIIALATNLTKEIEHHSKKALIQLDNLEQSYFALIKYRKLSKTLKREVDGLLNTTLKIKEVFVDISTSIQEAFEKDLVSIVKNKGWIQLVNNSSSLKDKQIYMENLNIDHYQEWFARTGLKKRLVIEIRFSDDIKYSFI